jgi:hypothetical protein
VLRSVLNARVCWAKVLVHGFRTAVDLPGSLYRWQVLCLCLWQHASAALTSLKPVCMIGFMACMVLFAAAGAVT